MKHSRYIKNPKCLYIFRGDLCKYKGEEIDCDGSFSTCKKYGNEENFGGVWRRAWWEEECSMCGADFDSRDGSLISVSGSIGNVGYDETLLCSSCSNKIREVFEIERKIVEKPKEPENIEI